MTKVTARSRTYHTVSRRRIGIPCFRRLIILLLTEPIPNPSNRLDQRWRKIPVNFTAQIPNVHIHNIGIRVKVKIPDMLDDLSPRQNVVWMPQKQLQQGKLARAELDPLAGTAHLALRK